MYKSTKEIVKNDAQMYFLANEINIDKFGQSQQTALYMVIASKIPKDKLQVIANEDFSGIDMIYLKDVYFENPDKFEAAVNNISKGS